MTETKTNQSRRAFLRKAGKVAIAAPAVALLLSVDAKTASAGLVVEPYAASLPDLSN